EQRGNGLPDGGQGVPPPLRLLLRRGRRPDERPARLQHPVDRPQHLLGVERLNEVVHHAEAKRLDGRFLRAFRRHQNGGDEAAALAELLHHLQPIEIGQGKICDNEIRAVGERRSQAFKAFLRNIDGVTFRAQYGFCHEVADLLIVVYDENARSGHRGAYLSSPAGVTPCRWLAGGRVNWSSTCAISMSSFRYRTSTAAW